MGVLVRQAQLSGMCDIITIIIWVVVLAWTLRSSKRRSVMTGNGRRGIFVQGRTHGRSGYPQRMSAIPSASS